MRWNQIWMLAAITTLTTGCLADLFGGQGNDGADEPLLENIGDGEPAAIVDQWELVQAEFATRTNGQVDNIAPYDEEGDLLVEEDGSADLAIWFTDGDLDIEIDVEGWSGDLDASVVSFDVTALVRSIDGTDVNEIEAEGELACQVQGDDLACEALVEATIYEGTEPQRNELAAAMAFSRAN